jgi:hypothetical protein
MLLSVDSSPVDSELSGESDDVVDSDEPDSSEAFVVSELVELTPVS